MSSYLLAKSSLEFRCAYVIYLNATIIIHTTRSGTLRISLVRFAWLSSLNASKREIFLPFRCVHWNQFQVYRCVCVCFFFAILILFLNFDLAPPNNEKSFVSWLQQAQSTATMLIHYHIILLFSIWIGEMAQKQFHKATEDPIKKNSVCIVLRFEIFFLSTLYSLL